jgi:hypothetical protein
MKHCSFLWAYAAQLAGRCFCKLGVTQTYATIFNWTFEVYKMEWNKTSSLGMLKAINLCRDRKLEGMTGKGKS